MHSTVWCLQIGGAEVAVDIMEPSIFFLLIFGDEFGVPWEPCDVVLEDNLKDKKFDFTEPWDDLWTKFPVVALQGREWGLLLLYWNALP